MVKRLPNFGLHRHLFPFSDIDVDILGYLKIDALFDRSFFNDRHLFGISKEDNLKMTAFINVIQLPLMFIVTMIKAE